MIDPRLTFEPQGHVYRYDGRVVPSVSEIIASCQSFVGIPPAVLQAAADRGTDVHLACELDDKGILDETSVADYVLPYLEAWRRFMREQQPTWSYIEEPMYHRLMDYAGTPDRVGFIGELFVVADIKTVVQVHPVYGLQGEGYANLVEALEGVRPTRMLVQLKNDGTYVVHEYINPFDRIAFQSMLNIRNWRTKHAR